MKRLIFWLIAVAAITLLLLPSGKAYARCVKFDDFSGNVLDSTKWTVENDGECYDYSVNGGKLEVISQRENKTCGENDRIFFIPKTSKQVKSIRVEVTQIEGDLCHRARVIVDPLIMKNGIGFEQLAIMEPRWDPRTNTTRFHCPDPGMSRYMLSDGSSSLYDGFFRRDLFPGWPATNGKTYILNLSVRKNEIASSITDTSTGRDLGTIIFAPPGGLKNKGHILGLSCFGPSLDSEVSSGTVLYDNVYLCF